MVNLPSIQEKVSKKMKNEKIILDSPALRLEAFILARYRVKNDFAKHLGIRWDVLAKYVGAGKKSVFGAKYLKKISDTGINIDWYLTGEGEMLLENSFEANVNCEDLSKLKAEIFTAINDIFAKFSINKANDKG